jgi:2'-hydroxyisoflavone reductase
MNILFIGGTQFVGRHIVRAAMARGHEITLFHRGRTNRGLFPEAEELIGDRDGELDSLGNRTWDVAVDSCGYVPRVVRQSAEFLKASVASYMFVSTISVYADTGESSLDESSELDTTDDPATEEINSDTYGPLKVLCEREVQRVYRDRSLIVRPGVVVGPHDPTDRFTYWVDRFNRGGDVLCPDVDDQPVQFIDARDLAAWIIRMIEQQKVGVYNATGPEEPLFLKPCLLVCRAVCGPHAHPVWVSDQFLREQDVTPFRDLPLWLSKENEPYQIMRADCSRAIADGLTFRPLDETMQDTLRWSGNRPQGYEFQAGLSTERECELLKRWFELAKPAQE